LLQVIPLIETSLRSVVCLSVVGHIRAFLNRSTDVNAIWPIHLWGTMTPCVRQGSDPSGRGVMGVKHQAKTCSCYQSIRKKWFVSPGGSTDHRCRFCKINLVLVLVLLL